MDWQSNCHGWKLGNGDDHRPGGGRVYRTLMESRYTGIRRGRVLHDPSGEQANWQCCNEGKDGVDGCRCDGRHAKQTLGRIGTRVLAKLGSSIIDSTSQRARDLQHRRTHLRPRHDAGPAQDSTRRCPDGARHPFALAAPLRTR